VPTGGTRFEVEDWCAAERLLAPLDARRRPGDVNRITEVFQGAADTLRTDLKDVRR